MRPARLLVCAVLAVASAGSVQSRAFAKEPVDGVRAAIRSLWAPDPAVRAQAAKDLAASYPEGARAVPALVESLRDEREPVRKAVKATLRGFADRAFVEAADLLQADARATATSWQVRTFEDEVRVVIAELGTGVTGTDLATGILEGAERETVFATLASVNSPRLPVLRLVITSVLDLEVAPARNAASVTLALLSEIGVSNTSAADAAISNAELRAVAVLRATQKTSETDPPGASPSRGLRGVAAGLLARSPVGGAEAIEALRAGASGLATEREALRLLSRSSSAARAALASVAEGGSDREDAAALAAGAEWAELEARLQAFPMRRFEAARALVIAGRATPAAVAVLVDDLKRSETNLHQRSLVPIGLAGSAAKEAQPLLQSLWQGVGEGADRRYLAWALWRVAPENGEARREVERILDDPAAEGTRLDLVSVIVLSKNAVESLLVRLLPIVRGDRVFLSRVDPTGLMARAAHQTSLRLIDQIGALGHAGAAASPALVERLRRETTRLAQLRAKVAAREKEGVKARLRLLWELGDEYETLMHPELALAIVRALEVVAAPSAELDAALVAFDALSGDVGHVAVARAKRVIAARFAPPR